MSQLIRALGRELKRECDELAHQINRTNYPPEVFRLGRKLRATGRMLLVFVNPKSDKKKPG